MPKKDSQFKKGRSGNPGGRPKLSEQAKEDKRLTTEEYITTACKFLFMTRTEIGQSLAKPESNMLELIIGGIIANAAKDSDERKAAAVFDRIIGKVTDNHKIDGKLQLEGTLHSQIVEALSKRESG